MSEQDWPDGVLPYCAFTTDGGPRRLGVGLGTTVVDLHALAGAVTSVPAEVLRTGSLDALLALGRAEWDALHAELAGLVHGAAAVHAAVPTAEVELHLAWTVADYVDFYSSLHHAENVGRIFRPDAEPLKRNWRHLPVAYHGRAGTVVVDGTPVRRPSGQQLVEGAVEVGPTRRLDVELEVGFVVGAGTELGAPVAVEDAAEHLFGVVLLNDWSARDVQSWEYVPLGPFLGKSFATSVSAWVVPTAALAAARVPGPVQSPVPVEYLRAAEPWTYDLDLELWLNGTRLTRVSTAQGLYWTPAQQLAHLTVNGASLRPGDLFATGTVSGPDVGQRGSLLEATWSGRDPLTLDDGSTRTYLQDGDTVVLRGSAGGVPLGQVAGTVVGGAVVGGAA